MKKFIFLSLVLVSWLTAVAQYHTEPTLSPGFISTKKQSFNSKPGNLKSTTSLISDTSTQKIDNNTNNTGRIQHSYRSPAFDQTWANRFQTVLDSIRMATSMRGTSLAVLVPGQGLLTCVSGNSSPGVPVTSAMRFGVMSNTKLFIAVTMTKLQEQGVLSLDDHLYQWLPTYPHVDSTTTIRQLLSHQSGIFDFWNDSDSLWNLMLSDTGRIWTPLEVLATIKAPHFAPGHGYRYSNTNYLLAGMVIEAATGMTWLQKMHDFIFDPLTMDSTFAGVFESRNGPVAAEYFIYTPLINSPMSAEYTQINAAGILLSTAQEMAEWYSALFGGEVISTSSLQQITDFETTSYYGLGLGEGLYKNHWSYNHTGGGLGYASIVWYDIQTQSTLCMLMNDRNGDFSTRVLPLLAVLYDDFPKKQNDAGISGINAPWQNNCMASQIPAVMLTNFGSAPLTSVNIHYKIDGGDPSLYNWTGSLSPGDTISIILPQINTGEGFHTFTCYTTLPNGAPEGYTWNDTTQSNFIVNVLPAVLSEINESFEGTIFPPERWSESSSSFFQWGPTSLAHFSGLGSVVKNNYNDGYIGTHYDLDLPLIHIASGTHPALEFEYAYAIYPNTYGDSLQVFFSSDCGNTWQTLFNKGGLDLSHGTYTPDPFYPQTTDEWHLESYSLAADTGDILIRFRDVCGFGNNLYLDDVKVSFPTGIAENGASEKFIVYPVPASLVINIIGLPVNSEVQITDLTGKLLMTQKTINGITTLDIHKFSHGVYILRSFLGVKKIIKM